MYKPDGEIFSAFYAEITPENNTIPVIWNSKTGGFLHSSYNMPGLKNPDVAASLFSKEEIQELCQPILEELKQVQKCIYCGVSYVSEDNFGTYKCRYHPDHENYPTFYSCCGKEKRGPTFGQGCIPCDHCHIFVEGRWNEQNNKEKIPNEAVLLLKIPEKSCVVVTDVNPNPLNNYTLVHRIKQD